MNTTTASSGTDLDLDQLEALARAATPGAWRSAGVEIHAEGDIAIGVTHFYGMRRSTTASLRVKNAAFIAAANPATVREFVEAVAGPCFNYTDRETDETCCSGCNCAEELVSVGEPFKEVHAENCIVLRARALLAAPVAVEDARDDRIANYRPGQWFDARSLDEMQAFYMSRLPAIREAAKEHGYAIGLHGSTRRDFDLMAMQWREDASPKDALAHAIAEAACGISLNGCYAWEKKPNGRFAVSMPICWTDHGNPEFGDKPSLGHIDLAVIDPSWMILLIDKRAEDYIRDHAETDPDTGAVLFNYGEAGREYHSTLTELAGELRAAMSSASANNDQEKKNAAE